MKLVLPVPPNRANGRGHWSKVHRDKLVYEREVWAVLQTIKKELPVTPAAYTSWQADFFVTHLYDMDNLVALCKWPLDALVKNGVMENDSPKHAWPKSFPTQTKVKRGYTSLILTLEFK